MKKDNRGRKLKEGESVRSDGRYMYRYMDVRTGKRKCIYACDLVKLREKEKKIQKDIDDHIWSDAYVEKLSVNDFFERYITTRELKESTKRNYISIWEQHVKNEIGCMKPCQVKPSHIKLFYVKLSCMNYSNSMVKLIHCLLHPTFEMAVEDDIIRKNPAKSAFTKCGKPPVERIALTREQQEKLLAFVEKSNLYSIYLPLLIVMIGTNARVGEIIGLTWSDVDMQKKEITIAKQLVYKNYGDGCKFHVSIPKTQAGVRIVPMTEDVVRAFGEQKKINFKRGLNRDIEIEGRKGFIFTSKNGSPLMPNAINNLLQNIVNAYNLQETGTAEKQRRKPELMPRISAHVLRHTGCTRMVERGVDLKVVQYIMGHTNVRITMDVYTHVNDRVRIAKEMEKMNVAAVI